jgi:hypothetical protein
MSKILFKILIGSTLVCFLFLSCQKDYSFEGSLISNPTTPVDTSIFKDTTRIDTTLNFIKCESCDSTLPLKINTWGLKTNKSYICGAVDTAIFNFGNIKNSISFWGQLNCQSDTGFYLVSFFHPSNFDSDRYNLSTQNQSLILQDHVNYMNSWSGYIFRTDGTTPHHTLTVVVDSFISASKLVVGRFYGYTYIRNTGKTYVDGGFRFLVN